MRAEIVVPFNCMLLSRDIKLIIERREHEIIITQSTESFIRNGDM